MTQKGQRMKYYVFKGRIKNDKSESRHTAGYKTLRIARSIAKKASKTWDYVEFGRYDEFTNFPTNEALGIYIDHEEQGGDKLWDSLTQASQQVQEEANLNLGDSQPEAKRMRLHSSKRL